MVQEQVLDLDQAQDPGPAPLLLRALQAQATVAPEGVALKQVRLQDPMRDPMLDPDTEGETELNEDIHISYNTISPYL